MSDGFSKIVAIFLTAILLFIVPVFYMKEEAERTKQTRILDEVTEFVDGVRNTGILGGEDYQRLTKMLYNLGGGYRVEMLHSTHIPSENGEDVLYFSKSNTEIDMLDELMLNGRYLLSKYDYLRVVVKNYKDEVIAWYGGSIRYEAY